MVGTSRRVERSLFPWRRGREAALFFAVAALFVDLIFYFSLADAQLGGRSLSTWSALKTMGIATIVGWLAYETESWALGLIAAIYAVIALEDAFGVTAPLGIWLLEEGGIAGGRQGANSQVIRRALIMVSLLGPVLYLSRRAPQYLHKALWVLLGFLALLFAASVLGDTAADRTGTNLDELVEEPLLSLGLAFAIGLAVEWWPRRQLRIPTTSRRRP